MSFNIIAVVRLDKKNSKGLVPICIKVYEGSKIIKTESLKQRVHVDFWDEDQRRVDKKYPNAQLLNSLIEKKISDLKILILEETIIKGEVDIKALLVKDKFREVNFYDFAEKQIREKNYAEETRRNYRVYVEKIKGYRKALKLSEINYQFLQGYESHLRDVLKNEPNTVWGNLKFINTMTNDALKMKFITDNPFLIFNRPKYKQTKRSFLNAVELAKIKDFTIKTEDIVLLIVAKWFLFMARTGLRFSDAIRFDIDEHVIDNERIVMTTQKTKQITNIYINDSIRELINFIVTHPLQITQTDFNRKIKLIAAYQGIHKKVSSHVARHSFGSSLAALGVSEKVAQGLLAHGSTSSTKIYYHLESPSLDEAMKRFDK